MANAKIHINLAQGLIEAEGEESFVRTVYEDFKHQLKLKVSTKGTVDDANKDNQNEEIPARNRGPRKVRVKRVGSSEGANDSGGGFASFQPKLNNDLDLSKLKAFVATYAPKTSYDHTTLFVYFLKETLGKTTCTGHDIFTCYRNLKVKAPTAFGQHLIDTRRNKGYIDYNSIHDIRITTAGNNYVEHDFPQKADAA